jgi:large subunit ribosomal protein L29
MKAKELKNIDTKDLVAKVKEAQRDLETMKFNHHVSPLENPSKIKASRRDIARMKTELRARELNK